ncbi:MAG: ABC transporter permease [Ruminococcus sp.]
MSDIRISRFGQVRVYTGKCFRTFINEKGWKLFISTLIISVILSWIVGDNTFSINESTKNGVFAMICGCIWVGLFNSIQSICRERDIIKREHRTGLHISSYIAAHLIFEFVICMAESVILTAVFDIFRDLPENGVVFSWITLEFFISFTLVIFAADALGLMISCIVRTEKAAMTVMPFVLIIQLVLSGLMFEIPENAEFVKELTISKWGLSAVCSSADINELPTKDTIEKFKEAALSGESISSWKDLGLTQEYEMDYDGSVQNVVKTWLVLIFHITVYTAAGTLFLKRIDRDKR